MFLVSCATNAFLVLGFPGVPQSLHKFPPPPTPPPGSGPETDSELFEYSRHWAVSRRCPATWTFGPTWTSALCRKRWTIPETPCGAATLVDSQPAASIVFVLIFVCFFVGSLGGSFFTL